MFRLSETVQKQCEGDKPYKVLFVGIETAAKMLDVLPRTISNLTKNKKLSVKQIGDRVLYSIDDLRAYAADTNPREKDQMTQYGSMFYGKFVSSVEQSQRGLYRNQVGGYVWLDRVSTSKQEDSLKHRFSYITKNILNPYGKELNIKGYFSEIAKGWSDKLSKRTELLKAIECVLDMNCQLLVPSISRLARRSDRVLFLPLEKEDWERLKEITRMVPIVTIIPPDTDPQSEWKMLVEWGKAETGNRGGRPPSRYPGYKRDIREEYEPTVWRLYCQNHSYRAISALIKHRYGQHVPFKTIQNWILKRLNHQENWHREN